jgi:tellurite resistance protein TehA-like permease
MAKSVNLPKTVIATKENLNVVSIVSQALINILIALQIVLEEELENCIGRIS